MSPKKCVADAFPEVLEQWVDSADPSQITIGSGRDIEWQCSNGHKWTKPPAQRFRNGKIASCPVCKKGPPISETHPEALHDWNDSLHDPNDLTYGVATKINWKCHSCDHEWVASPNNRMNKGILKPCPHCSSGVLHSDRRNSLQALNPELSEEWNGEKNGTNVPSYFTLGSDYNAWWRCRECDNEWQTTIANRNGLGTGCPTCSLGRLHSDNRNSLLNVNPELAAQWHPTKNGNLTPNDVILNHPKKVWWYCDKSTCEHPHEWELSPNARYSSNTGCPFCAGNQASFCPCDSLASTNPELAAELHPDEPTPATEISQYSVKKVLWLCKKSTCEHEHAWYSAVNNRSAGNGCPFCAGKSVCKCTSLGGIFPELVPEWSQKNGSKSPFEFTPFSSKKVWWVCSHNQEHEWKSAIVHRTGYQQSGCPSCAKPGFDPISPAFYYVMQISGPSEIWWFKGGISKNPEQRRIQITTSLKANNMNLKVSIIEQVEFEKGFDAKELESNLLEVENIRVKTKEKFSGARELFAVNPLEYARTNGMLKQKKLIQSTIFDFY